MTNEEFKLLKNKDVYKEKVINGKNLGSDIKDRTLIYGYTCERRTFHVYIKNGEIHIVVYDNDYLNGIKPKNMKEIIPTSNYEFVPSKRAYPERCDYKFCKLLKSVYNVDICFTTFEDGMKSKDFYGFTLEDL